MSGIAKAFALFSGASAIGTLTQVAKGKITAVFLGPEGVGVLNQLTTLWSLLSLVAGMGFYTGMVRHLSESWENNDKNSFGAQASSSLMFLCVTSFTLTGFGCLFSAQLSSALFGDGGARADLVSLILLSIPVFTIAQVYRAMLNATRRVELFVRASIFAEVGSVIALLLLIYPFGLQGAILSYLAFHVLYLISAWYFFRIAVGTVKPSVLRLSHFRSDELVRNAGYGLNGLVAVAVGVTTTLIISRWIIDDMGMSANGIYVMAVKVASVYLGGLTATAGGYYFPTLSAARSDLEMHRIIDQTLSLYLYVVPPILVALMVGGEVLMMVLFSSEFTPAALLLLVMLPGDLFRISAETAGLPLVVRKHFVTSTGLYLLWALMYLSMSYVLLPRYGLLGIAFAYLASQVLNCLLVFAFVHWKIGYRVAPRTALAMLRGLLLVAAGGLAVTSSYGQWMSYALAALLVLIWFGSSLRDQEFLRILRATLNQLKLLLVR